MLVSSTEPKIFHQLGDVSTKSEEYGADFLMVGQGMTIGIQRKEVKDLLASVENGLLGKQLAQLAGVDIAFLVIEGRMDFTLDGKLTNAKWGGQAWTQEQIWGLTLSVMGKNVHVMYTIDMPGTANLLVYMEAYFRKASHNALDTRPGPRGMFGAGRTTAKEMGVYLLQSLPGVGPALAERIYDKFGVPWKWTVGKDELEALEGLGPKKVAKIMGVFNE